MNTIASAARDPRTRRVVGHTGDSVDVDQPIRTLAKARNSWFVAENVANQTLIPFKVVELLAVRATQEDD